MLVVARRCKREEQGGGEDERRGGRAVGEEGKKEKTAKVREKENHRQFGETEEELRFVFLHHLRFHLEVQQLQFHHLLVSARHSRRENRQRQTMKRKRGSSQGRTTKAKYFHEKIPH